MKRLLFGIFLLLLSPVVLAVPVNPASEETVETKTVEQTNEAKKGETGDTPKGKTVPIEIGSGDDAGQEWEDVRKAMLEELMERHPPEIIEEYKLLNQEFQSKLNNCSPYSREFPSPFDPTVIIAKIIVGWEGTHCRVRQISSNGETMECLLSPATMEIKDVDVMLETASRIGECMFKF